MHKLLGTIIIMMTMVFSPLTWSEEDEGSTEVIRPPHKQMESSHLTLNDHFSSFRRGPMFSPEFLMLAFLLGYANQSNLFADFFKSLSSSYEFDEESNVETVEDELCEGESGDQSEGVVKLSFDCSNDGLIYSCYADLVDGEYSISIPSNVEGLTCKISVEAGKMNDDSTDIDVSGVETEEEVDLSEETAIVIDVGTDDDESESE